MSQQTGEWATAMQHLGADDTQIPPKQPALGSRATVTGVQEQECCPKCEELARAGWCPNHEERNIIGRNLKKK